jgi:integrase
MARRIRSHKLETRANRLRLAIQKQPYYVGLARGLRLGYRRCKTDGTWSTLTKHGLRRLAFADDYSDANGHTVLTYDQVVSRARTEIFGQDETAGSPGGEKPITVDMAIDAYAADLAAREGMPANARWLRTRMPASLRSRVLSTLDAKDFRKFRDDTVAAGDLARSSVNRLMKSVKAACNLAASLDKRIANRGPWTTGLQGLPNAERSRNVVITEAEIGAIVRAGTAIAAELGLMLEVLAVTGSRISQAARLTVADVQADRVLMPVSRKGRGRRAVDRRPVPIPASLARRLHEIARGRPGDAPLLRRPNGQDGPWRTSDHFRLVYAAVAAAGLDPDTITISAMRHSSITRALLKGVPTRLVADVHDTSVQQIEKTYSKYISHHGDAMLRAGMLDLEEGRMPSASAPEAGNVVAIGRRPA